MAAPILLTLLGILSILLLLSYIWASGLIAVSKQLNVAQKIYLVWATTGFLVAGISLIALSMSFLPIDETCTSTFCTMANIQIQELVTTRGDTFWKLLFSSAAVAIGLLGFKSTTP